MYNTFNRFQDTASPAKNLEYEGPTSDGGKNRIRNFFYLWPLLFLIVALLFSIVMLHYNGNVHSKDTGDANDALNNLKDNLNYHPIEDVKTVAATEPCPAGFDQESMGKYQGTDSGCLCADGSVHTQSYCWFKSETECKYSSSTNSKAYKVFMGTKICSKRYESWVFSHKDAVCPTTHTKKCGDTVCLTKDKTLCPVSGIKIEDGAAADGENKVGAANKLTITREETAGPIVALKSEISNIPCSAINRRRPETASKKVYPLDTVKATGCGKYGDIKPIATLIKGEPLASFQKGNEIDVITTTLPFYSHYTTTKDEVNLYAEARAPIKDSKECSTIDSNSVADMAGAISHIGHIINIIAILIIVFAAIGILLALLFLILRHKLAFLNSRGTLYAIYAIAIIVAILCIVLFALYVGTKDSHDLDKAHNHFGSLIKNKCLEKTPGFDTAAKDVVTISDKIKHNVGYIIKTLFGAALVFLAVFLIAAGLRKAKKMAPLPDPRA